MCIVSNYTHQLIGTTVESVFNDKCVRHSSLLCKNFELSMFILYIFISLCILILKNNCIFYPRKMNMKNVQRLRGKKSMNLD